MTTPLEPRLSFIFEQLEAREYDRDKDREKDRDQREQHPRAVVQKVVRHP